MTLRRADGRIYLDRWGFETRFFGVYLHRIDAPDPGVDLHDHPWSFASLILAGGYYEERVRGREAPRWAEGAERFEERYFDDGREIQHVARGVVVHRPRFSLRSLRLDEAHRIVELDDDRPCWTLVFRGPRRRVWGFYMPTGWVDADTYDKTVRAQRRDLWNEVG